MQPPPETPPGQIYEQPAEASPAATMPAAVPGLGAQSSQAAEAAPAPSTPVAAPPCSGCARLASICFDLNLRVAECEAKLARLL